ncbi:MAG: hypothetical protein ACR2MY_02065 [Candidatus Dormibacteria bacterium]
MRYTSDELHSDSQISCPDCGEGCSQGVRGRGVLIATCSTHGVFITSRRADRDHLGAEFMHCEERLWLIERSLERFLIDPDADDFMAIQSSTLPCNQLLFRFVKGGFILEVGSREWDCPVCGNRPLGAEARDALVRLGFERLSAGPNPTALDLPRNRRELAMLADDAMLRAYGEAGDFEVGVYFKRTEVLRDILAQLASLN